MEKRNNKGILLLVCISIILCAVCLIEYALLSNSREQNRKLKSGELQTEKTKKAATSKKEQELSEDGVKAHGELSVKGTDLTDKNGEKVQLRGMSSHGLLWYPEYTNYASIYETKKHGANMFRIAMYSDDGNGAGGYVQNPELSWKLMQAAIENTLAADMYALVDWHVLLDENPLRNVEKAKEFFSKVSARYKEQAGIIYEICNEPNGDTSWEDIVEYAKQVIPVIRANAPEAVILVGTPDYSYSITKVKKDELPYSNLMYSYHFYAGQYDNSYKNMIEDCQSVGIPIFVSEWGINTEQGGKDALKQGEEFASYLNQKGISFAAWSLSNKDEVFSALKSDCKKYSSWKEKDLTEVGSILFSALGGK